MSKQQCDYLASDANWAEHEQAISEGFQYDPCGQVAVADHDGQDASGEGHAWQCLHEGLCSDGDTAMYHFRHRDYSPSLGRWVQQDAMGYVDGMSLYEYVKGGPTSARDASGLLTEQEALTILRKQIQTWRTKDFGMAANLLQHFIDRKGPRAYETTLADVREIGAHAYGGVSTLLSVYYDPGEHGVNVSLSRHLAWTPSGGAMGFFNPLDPHYQDDNMFYAYGGVDVTVTVLRAEREKRRGSNVHYLDIRVDMSDLYTFAPRGAMGMRTWFESYEAARFLETECGYQPFRHTLSYTQARVFWHR